jgi:hypothetical protein
MSLKVQELKGLVGAEGDEVSTTVEVSSDDVGPLEQEALSHILKFNNVATELNGILIDASITSVDLSLAPLELYEIVFLSKRLDLSFKLTDLNLSGCAIDADGMTHLAPSIGLHKTIEVSPLPPPLSCCISTCIPFTMPSSFLTTSDPRKKISSRSGFVWTTTWWLTTGRALWVAIFVRTAR